MCKCWKAEWCSERAPPGNTKLQCLQPLAAMPACPGWRCSRRRGATALLPHLSCALISLLLVARPPPSPCLCSHPHGHHRREGRGAGSSPPASVPPRPPGPKAQVKPLASALQSIVGAPPHMLTVRESPAGASQGTDRKWSHPVPSSCSTRSLLYCRRRGQRCLRRDSPILSLVLSPLVPLSTAQPHMCAQRPARMPQG